jgi:adhesin transport system membrane fusion protein
MAQLLTDIKRLDTTEKKQVDSPDLRFVNPLYNAANAISLPKIDMLFVVLVITFSTLIIWANIAKIDEITSGQGKVIPSGKLQKIQYLDGGTVAEILVKETDHVVVGQELLKVDTTRFQSSFEETQENIFSLKTKKVRLQKELEINYKGALPKLEFSKELLKTSPQYVKSQKQIFKSTYYKRKNNLRVVALQYKQKLQELREIQSKETQLRQTLKYTKEQLDTIKKMVKSGSKSRHELLGVEKEYNTLKGDLRSASLSIPRSRLAIEEAQALMEEKLQTMKTEISTELEETINKIRTIEAHLVSDTDKLDKTTIVSPVNGTIKQININTIGSVIQSGADLMEIVPDSNILFIEAKIDPKDIAFINPESRALIKLTAYDFSIYGGLDASIVEISVDSIKDKDSKDGKSYYKVVLKTDKNYLEYGGKKLRIIPGMVASVDIFTGKKTVMDFILKPILKVKQGAFHER